MSDIPTARYYLSVSEDDLKRAINQLRYAKGDPDVTRKIALSYARSALRNLNKARPKMYRSRMW